MPATEAFDRKQGPLLLNDIGGLIYFYQFHIKNQRRVGADVAAGAAFAVGQV